MRRRKSGTFSKARATTAWSRPSWSRSSSRRGRKSGALAGWKPPGASFHEVFMPILRSLLRPGRAAELEGLLVHRVEVGRQRRLHRLEPQRLRQVEVSRERAEQGDVEA